ncbi:MAG: primosomal protein [Actinomycetota bacterium]|nr:primosomal protein [Actinomycetota bacterium]
MSADPRAALATLVSALERHLEAAGSKRGENDPVVFAAYQDVAEAFDVYDDALLDAFDEVTPLEVYHEGSEEDDADDLDEDDADGSAGGDDSDDAEDELDELDADREDGSSYQGLDDEDYDEDSSAR